MNNGYLYGAVTVALWAGFVLLARLAGNHGLNGFDLTALRFGVATIFLLPAWLFWRPVPLLNHKMLALTATGGISYALCVYSAFHFAPATHGAVLLSGILPFFVTLMAWLVLKETPSPARWRALGVIGFGVLCLARYSLSGLQQSWPGDLLLVASSALWGLYTVLVKRWELTPWDITIGVALLSAALYLPVYLLFLPKGLPTAPWSTIFVQGIFHGVLVVIVAMLTFMQAMAKLGPTRLGAVMATVPAAAGLGAVLVLGEPFSWLLVIGLLLTSAGAWLGSRA